MAARRGLEHSPSASAADAGNIPVHRRGKYRISRAAFVQWNATTLRRVYADRKSAAKAIAVDADVSTRTAEGWLDGTSAPRAESFTNLLFNNPAYEAEYRRIRRMEAEFDPDFMRAVVEQVMREIKGK